MSKLIKSTLAAVLATSALVASVTVHTHAETLKPPSHGSLLLLPPVNDPPPPPGPNDPPNNDPANPNDPGQGGGAGNGGPGNGGPGNGGPGAGAPPLPPIVMADINDAGTMKCDSLAYYHPRDVVSADVVSLVISSDPKVATGTGSISRAGNGLNTNGRDPKTGQKTSGSGPTKPGGTDGGIEIATGHPDPSPQTVNLTYLIQEFGHEPTTVNVRLTVECDKTPTTSGLQLPPPQPGPGPVPQISTVIPVWPTTPVIELVDRPRYDEDRPRHDDVKTDPRVPSTVKPSDVTSTTTGPNGVTYQHHQNGSVTIVDQNGKIVGQIAPAMTAKADPKASTAAARPQTDAPLQGPKTSTAAAAAATRPQTAALAQGPKSSTATATAVTRPQTAALAQGPKSSALRNEPKKAAVSAARIGSTRPSTIGTRTIVPSAAHAGGLTRSPLAPRLGGPGGLGTARASSGGPRIVASAPHLAGPHR
jgi:hypothetical protein